MFEVTQKITVSIVVVGCRSLALCKLFREKDIKDTPLKPVSKPLAKLDARIGVAVGVQGWRPDAEAHDTRYDHEDATGRCGFRR